LESLWVAAKAKLADLVAQRGGGARE